MIETKIHFLGWIPEITRDATERAMTNFPTLFIDGTWNDANNELQFGLYTDEQVDLSAFWKLRETFLSNEKGT